MTNPPNPKVGVLMGSKSDWGAMRKAAETLNQFNVPHESLVMSAHRTPARCRAYAESARERGLQALIVGAGGAAHLAGAMAAMCTIPVLGVPMLASALGGADALYATVQMPRGVPVATFAIGEAGAANAALFAVALMALSDDDMRQRLDAYRADFEASVPKTPE